MKIFACISYKNIRGFVMKDKKTFTDIEGMNNYINYRTSLLKDKELKLVKKPINGFKLFYSTLSRCLGGIHLFFIICFVITMVMIFGDGFNRESPYWKYSLGLSLVSLYYIGSIILSIVAVFHKEIANDLLQEKASKNLRYERLTIEDLKEVKYYISETALNNLIDKISESSVCWSVIIDKFNEEYEQHIKEKRKNNIRDQIL